MLWKLVQANMRFRIVHRSPIYSSVANSSSRQGRILLASSVPSCVAVLPQSMLVNRSSSRWELASPWLVADPPKGSSGLAVLLATLAFVRCSSDCNTLLKRCPSSWLVRSQVSKSVHTRNTGAIYEEVSALASGLLRTVWFPISGSLISHITLYCATHLVDTIPNKKHPAAVIDNCV